MKKLLFLSLAALVFAACSHPEPNDKSFVDVAGVDSSIKPGDNFFRYVNGHWYDTAKIADDQTGVGSYMFLNIPQKTTAAKYPGQCFKNATMLPEASTRR